MKVKIHPLFFATLLFCALFGGLPATLTCLVTALLHESGHIFCAEKMGFECSEVKIMPYGASAAMDIEGIRAGDEIKLALFGPLVNVFICVFLAGLWWFLPESYAYTDTVMQSNAAMLAVNLLPCHPLDGGRAVGCALTKFFGRRVSEIILKVNALLCAAGLIVAFFFSGYNPSLIFFALFLVVSAGEKAPQARLINFSSKGRLKRGIEVRYVLCDRSFTYRQAFKMLDDKRYLVLQLYGEDGIADEITQDELYDSALKGSIYDSVFGEDRLLESRAESYLSKNERENSSGDILPEITDFTHSQPKLTASSTAPEREE